MDIAHQNVSSRAAAFAPIAHLSSCTRDELQAMLAAGEQVLTCERVLREHGLTIVGQALNRDGGYDRETHAQYYYHSHRAGEHGHFHTFQHQRGMPPGMVPAPEAALLDQPQPSQASAHIIAISMDETSSAVGLFTTNWWVTGEVWYAAVDVCAMLERFYIGDDGASWAVNRWLTGMLRLFRPQIEALIHERDARLRELTAAHPDVDAFRDRRYEVLSEARIDVAEQMEALRAALAA